MPNYSLEIASGALTVDGTTVSLDYYHLVASSGAITVGGSALTLKCDRHLAVVTGYLTITGTAASMEHGGHLDGISGALTITGTVVSLTYKTWAVQNHAVMFIPYLTCNAANSGLECAVPVLTIESEGYAGLTAYLTESFPVLSSTGESSVWSFADDIEIPVVTLESYSGAISEFDLLVLTTDSTGTLHEIGELSITTSNLTIRAEGWSSEVASFDSLLPILTISSTGMESLVGTLTVSVPILEMELSSGYIVPVGIGDMTLSIIEVNKNGIVAGRFEYPVLGN
jgi:ethanolamine utilization microcompartment shell protein EutS